MTLVIMAAMGLITQDGQERMVTEMQVRRKNLLAGGLFNEPDYLSITELNGDTWRNKTTISSCPFSC